MDMQDRARQTHEQIWLDMQTHIRIFESSKLKCLYEVLTLSISSQCVLLIRFLYSLIESLFHPRELETWSYKNVYTNVHSGIIHNYKKCKHPNVHLVRNG